MLFVALRWAVAADGDISRFVVAGTTFVDPDARPPGDGHLHVFPSAGYDGQFYWRLAVDPTEWRRGAHHGVTFDSAYRAPRIGYPLLAHLAAGGRAGLVVWSLVGVNVGAMGLVAYSGARVAAHGGRHPLWGLAVAAAPGLVMALGRDLAECLTVACLVGGIAALAAGRPLVAAGSWTLAVLSREQALITVAAYGACRLLSPTTIPDRWRSRHPADEPPPAPSTGSPPPDDPPAVPPPPDPYTDSPPPDAPPASGRLLPGSAQRPGQVGGDRLSRRPERAGPGRGEGAWRGVGAVGSEPWPPAVEPPGPRGRGDGRLGVGDLPWAGPVVAFGAWQALLWHATGRLPLAAAGGTNLVPPFADLVPGLVGWARGDLGRIHAVAPLQLAVAVALVVAAARAARTVPGESRYTVVALATATAAGTCLAASIWRDPSDLRHLVDVSVLSWVVLLAAGRPVPRWAAWATALVWMATATARILAV